MRKGNAKRGIVVGMLCMVLAVVGIVAFSPEVQPVDSVSTVNPEALPVLSSNLTNLSSVVIDERGESENSNSAVELYLEHQKNIVNASGWNEYIISITNPNEVDIHKTIYLEGTRYNWDDTECWIRDSDFDGKTVATLENMTVHPGDTVQVTVPVQLKATGERNFYIFKVRSEGV
uniref:Uncharacterized protein n=1 Tax=Candidatus Methanophaga sp. ANME-1 ERB7 TaxID=2759913 RepID=A0A7G9ZCR7_9EURY|nr:hypothetical protein BLAHKPKO_00015 [Methanosarcinales archaeon ANME-1 ERB7]